jgi:hypothetical protein
MSQAKNAFTTIVTPASAGKSSIGKAETTRRELLASVCGAAAAASICAAPALAAADPVFAAIEAHKAAYVFHGECIDKVGKMEQAYFDALREWKEKPETVIAEGAENLLAILQPTQPDTTLAQARGLLDAVARQEIEKDHAASRMEAERLNELGCDTASDALLALCATVPTSLAGTAALVGYMLAEIGRDGIDNLLSRGMGGDDDTLGATLLRSILASVSPQA